MALAAASTRKSMEGSAVMQTNFVRLCARWVFPRGAADSISKTSSRGLLIPEYMGLLQQKRSQATGDGLDPWRRLCIWQWLP
jgi:hypothetical protein